MACRSFPIEFGPCLVLFRVDWPFRQTFPWVAGRLRHGFMYVVFGLVGAATLGVANECKAKLGMAVRGDEFYTWRSGLGTTSVAGGSQENLRS